ncbi:hypothetical protein JCM5353_000289 [Sporobolomyces roseus]
MDRLSLLPNELLDDIFDLSHTLKQPLTGPLSKRLLPFFHRSFYRDISLSSYEQLEQLCQTSEARPDLPSHIRTLKFAIPIEENESELEDPQRPTNDAVLNLLSHLNTLKKLRIFGVSRIACLLLFPPDSTIYPFRTTLLVLQLGSSFDPHHAPYRLLFDSELHQYRALESLVLHVDRTEGTIDSDADGLENTNTSRNLSSRIGFFQLSGPLAGSRYAEMILGSIPAPVEIRLLHTETSPPPIRELLSRVQQPRLVTDLDILANSSDRLGSHVFSPLRLFTQLRSIKLCVRVAFEDVLLALSGASLEFIHLRWTCEVATTTLTELVTGNTKIETLKYLVLDIVDADRGHPVPRKMAREELETLDLEDLDWYGPQWTNDFSRDGFKEFLKVAASEGVKVTGDAVEALEIEDEWEEEMKYYGSVLKS